MLQQSSNRLSYVLRGKSLQTRTFRERNKTKLSWKTNNEKAGYSDFGNGYISNLSNNAEIDSFISFSCEIIGYGEPVTQLDIQENLNYTLNVTI